jgi:pimeloyl-ACP methyl ester carboxylesterase
MIMRYWKWAAAVACVAACLPARAQNELGATPQMVACPDAIATLATCYSARLLTGAYLLAAMPRDWNGTLIVFAHGGPSEAPPTAETSRNDLEKYAVEVRRGFAWIASSYRREGYGVKMAAADSEDARAFFIDHIATPQHTIVHGASYGGLVAARMAELYPRSYEGVFTNSGLLSGPVKGYAFRADLRAVYQYYCRNLPRPNEPQYPLWMGLDHDSRMTVKELRATVDECTGVEKSDADRTPQQKQNLANILGVMGFSEAVLVRHIQAATLLFREIAERVTDGKSAFSNMGVVYKGSTDDAALNRDVIRFAADPSAVAALKEDGEPTGALTVPMVAIHSINDPQVVVETEAAYRDFVTAAGHGDMLVQAYTDENAHTSQSAAELAAAIDALMAWIEKGTKPTPQTIADGCKRFGRQFAGPCAYHPEYEAKPLATRFYSRQMTAAE